MLNRRIAISGISIMASLAIMAGATFAYFTDSDVSNDNQFSSGTLEIEVNDNGTAPTFNFNIGSITGLVPGSITESSVIKVVNDGSINAATFGRLTTSNPVTADLSDELSIYEYKVEYFSDASCTTPVARWAVKDPYFGTDQNEDWFIKEGEAHANFIAAGGTKNLKAWINGNGPLDLPGTEWDMEGMKPNACYKLTLQFQMDEDASNAYQGSSINVGYQVLSGQINAAALNSLGLSAGDMSIHVPYLESQVN